MDHTYSLCLNVFLILIIIVCSMDQRCGLPPLPELGMVTVPGDIIIGVLLGIHVDKIYQQLTFSLRPPKSFCTLFSLDFYHQLKTVIHTTEEINSDPNVLANVTLGFQMFDTCNIPHYELQGALHFLTEFTTLNSNNWCDYKASFPVITGSTISSNSVILANVLGAFRYPQISPYSSVSLLSNQKMFPSFFRTVPSDKLQSIGLAQLILRFGWTWIGLVASDNDHGLQGIQSIKQEIIKAGACIAFTEYIRLGQQNRNAPNIVKTIKESTVRVVVVFSLEVDVVPVVNEMLKQKIIGRIFIGNTAWSRSILLSARNYLQIFSGALGLAVYDYVVPGLGQFLQKMRPSLSMEESWENLYWEKVFNCKFYFGNNLTNSLKNPVRQCTGKEDLNDVINSSTFMNSLKFSYTTYASLIVLATALDNLKSCKEGDGPFAQGTCADIWNFKPWQLTYYIRKARLTLSNGYDFYFDNNGDPPAVYSIVNWQLSPDETLKQVHIGTYRSPAPPGQALTINVSLLQWPTGDQQVPRSVCSESCPPGFRKAARTGQPACCFDCVQCLQGEIANQTDSTNCIKCPWDQWPNSEKTRCLPKSMEFLSYEDPLGEILSAVTILSSGIPAFILFLFIIHRQTPIVKANNYSLSCLLLISLCLCFVCSLLFIGYPHHDNCLLRQVLFGLAFTLCVSSILAKTIMVVFAFMATRPDSNLRRWTSPKVSYTIILTCFLLEFILCITWLSLAPPFPQYNTETKPGVIIVDCNEGSPIAFWTMLSYLFLLATISFVVAFFARKLPDRFNEAQFISFSMLAFLSVWIAFIPASLSAQGKYTVAMEIFAILASSWALVICMFFPKCLIILFRPDKNNRHLVKKKIKITIKLTARGCLLIDWDLHNKCLFKNTLDYYSYFHSDDVFQ